MTHFSDNLKYRARYWAGQITSLAKSFAPAHLQSKIKSKVEEIGEGEYIIRTTVKAPDARAWEYGSGLRARRGPKQKYSIRPKSGHKFLAFQWDVADANPEQFRFAPDGRVLLTSVQHPGILAANEGKGYIAPAQVQIRKRLKEQLLRTGAEAIKLDLRESFRKQ